MIIYIYIQICIFEYLYARLHACNYIYIFLNIYQYTRIYVDMCIFMIVLIIAFSDIVYVKEYLYASKNLKLRVHNENTFPK